MRARTRLTIWVVLTAIVLSTGIGVFSLINSRSSDYKVIDEKIEVVIRDIMRSESEPLSAALYSIESHKYDFALAITPKGATPIEVLTTSDGANRDVTFRERSLELENGDLITISAPTAEITQNFRESTIQLSGFIFLLNTLYIIIGFFYIRGVSRREDRLALSRMQAFIGDASHELRTPLTVIKGYSELLTSGQLTEEPQRNQAQTRVTNEIKRMENIITDLLLLAELGEIRKGTFEPVNLGELVEGHARDFAALYPQRQVEIAIEDVTVEANPEHLHRLLNNALGNIARHTPANAPVRISLNSGEKKRLVIEDGGPGLPPEAYGKAITKFERFDKSRSREKGGSGLGMSIMQAIVEEHKGTFLLRRSDLGGVALEILLP